LWGLLATSAIQFILVVLYPILIAPLFNKFEPLKDESLAEQVKHMAAQVGMKVDGIFQMDAGRRSTHSNAYFTGLGRTKRIVLFDTLLDTLSHDEILGVLAHELGHFKRRHIVKSYLTGQLIMLAAFYLTYLMMNWEPLYAAFGIPASQSYGLLLIVGIFWQRLGFFVKPLSMMLSRRFERQADAFAVSLRGSSGPLVTALKKMADHNLSNLFPHPLYVWAHYSHPPLVERINRMEAARSAS
jgi:STE24 endopeptidase